MISGHVFIATSLDGFIARPDGAIDWLLAQDAVGEDHGYEAFIAEMDAIVMGRGTYEAVAAFDPWPYALPVLVLSGRLAGSSVPDRLQARVQFADLTPRAAMDRLQGDGVRRVYVDGGQIVQAFLRDGLIADMVLTQVPVLIGAGRRLFGPLTDDVALAHEKTRAFPSGLVQSRYRVGEPRAIGHVLQAA
jgi:dihydrofolate reductase